MTTPISTVDLDTLRETMRRALLDLATIPDDALEGPWPWPDHGELELRNGFFITIEDLERTAADIGRLGDGRTRAEATVTPAAVAAWDVLGVLATTREEDLDADPGGGEWTIRRALAHTLASQRSYAIYTDWWRQQRFTGGTWPLPEPPDGLDAPDLDETGADGSLDEVRRRFHEFLDEAASRLADLSDAELDLAARWYGTGVTVGYRQGRWSVHMAEHTIQVEKTLVMLGRAPTEVDRLVRRVARAWGWVERSLWPVPANDAAPAIAAAVATRTAATAADLADTARRG